MSTTLPSALNPAAAVMALQWMRSAGSVGSGVAAGSSPTARSASHDSATSAA